MVLIGVGLFLVLMLYGIFLIFRSKKPDLLTNYWKDESKSRWMKASVKYWNERK